MIDYKTAAKIAQKSGISEMGKNQHIDIPLPGALHAVARREAGN